jgi:hypothetical protein
MLIRGDYFWYGSVVIKKKSNQTEIKKNLKPVQTDRFQFGLVFLDKTGSNRFASVFSI